MKVLRWFLPLLLITSAAAQSTTVTATVTDSDGFVWAYGSVAANQVNGLNLPVTGKMNSSGAFSIAVPYGTWVFTLCADVSANACVTSQPFTLSTSTLSLTSQLSAIAGGLRFPPSASMYGYGTVEVSGTPSPGAQFYAVGAGCLQWNGSAWAGCGALNVSCPFNQTATTVASTYTPITTCSNIPGLSASGFVQMLVQLCGNSANTGIVTLAPYIGVYQGVTASATLHSSTTCESLTYTVQQTGSTSAQVDSVIGGVSGSSATVVTTSTTYALGTPGALVWKIYSPTAGDSYTLTVANVTVVAP